MKKTLRKVTALLTTLALGTSLLTGCGSKTAGNQDAAGKKDGVTVVKVATGGGPAPYIFVDDDGTLSGYDVEVVNELFSRIDDYDIEWEITEFASIFTGLDAGLYQVGVNHFGFNTERAEKYIYSDVISIDPTAILVSENNTDIKTVYDLPGHVTEVAATSYYLSVFENFNEAHPDKPIDYVYVENVGQTPLHVSDGSVDFEIFTKTTLKSQVESLGLTDVKFIDVPTEDSKWLTSGDDKPAGTFFLIAKGNEDLANKLSVAFEAAVEDGTIFALQSKYLGTTEENKLTLDQVKESRQSIEELISNIGK